MTQNLRWKDWSSLCQWSRLRLSGSTWLLLIPISAPGCLGTMILTVDFWQDYTLLSTSKESEPAFSQVNRTGNWSLGLKQAVLSSARIHFGTTAILAWTSMTGPHSPSEIGQRHTLSSTVKASSISARHRSILTMRQCIHDHEESEQEGNNIRLSIQHAIQISKFGQHINFQKNKIFFYRKDLTKI